MEYLNFDVEITEKQEAVYLVAARSEAGEARHLMRFPLEGLALDNTLLRVQNALLRAGNIYRDAGTPEEQIVQTFGQTLFEALLAGDVRRLYDASRAHATQQGHGVRVRLHILAPELAALPWEFLYDPLQREYLCFLPETVIVRYLETAQPIPPFKVDLPLRILAMIAAPSDQARLNLAREQLSLHEALGALEQRGLVKLSWVAGQTWQALQDALSQAEWHIFHFIGHGALDPRTQEGKLALVNEQDQKTYLLSATDLGRLLAQWHSLRLVVLNACQGAAGDRQDLFSILAATLVSKRIPAVLAMQYDITDQAAEQFTGGFYRALAGGLPVESALTQARTAISLGIPRTLEWVTPVLYLRAPTGVLFDLPPLAATPAPSSQPQSNPLEPTATPPTQALPASPAEVLPEPGKVVPPAAETRPFARPAAEAQPFLERILPASLLQKGFVGKILNVLPVIISPVCHVRAGSFLMGLDKDKIQPNPLRALYTPEAAMVPQHTVMVEAYHIGKYPVTVAEYACAVFAAAVEEPASWQEQLLGLDHPVVDVSWHNALRYVQWLSQLTGQPWDLPTEAEWEKAARGTDGRLYPWGNTWQSTFANTSKTKLERTTPVGVYPAKSASPYGVYDLVGNVYEWTRSRFEPYPYNPNDGRESIADPEKERVCRGSGFRRSPYKLETAVVYRDDSNSPDYTNDDLGFRVVLRQQDEPHRFSLRNLFRTGSGQ